MPLPVDNLTPASNPQEIQEAIGQSIQQCIEEGQDQKQCAAIAFSTAREKTGKELSPEGA